MARIVLRELAEDDIVPKGTTALIVGVPVPRTTTMPHEDEEPAGILTLLEGLQAWKISVDVDGKKFDGEYVADANGVHVRLAGTSWLDAIWSHRVEGPQVVARDLLRHLAQRELDLAETRYVLVRVKEDVDPDLLSRLKLVEGVTRVFFRATDIVTVCFGEDPRAAAFLMHRLSKIEGVQSVEIAPEHRHEGD